MHDLQTIVAMNNAAVAKPKASDDARVAYAQAMRALGRAQALRDAMSIEGYTLDEVREQLREMYDDAMRDSERAMDNVLEIANKKVEK